MGPSVKTRQSVSLEKRLKTLDKISKYREAKIKQDFIKMEEELKQEEQRR